MPTGPAKRLAWRYEQYDTKRVSAPECYHGKNRKQMNQNERLNAWRRVVGAIAEKGFLREVDIPESFVKRLTDPIFVNPPARVYTLSGVAHNGRRQRFSTIDLLGRPLHRTPYVVVNDEKFREWASDFMESSFRAENPHHDRVVKSAFTHFMHDSNLHWSGCGERRQAMGKTGPIRLLAHNRAHSLARNPDAPRLDNLLSNIESACFQNLYA